MKVIFSCQIQSQIQSQNQSQSQRQIQSLLIEQMIWVLQSLSQSQIQSRYRIHQGKLKLRFVNVKQVAEHSNRHQASFEPISQNQLW